MRLIVVVSSAKIVLHYCSTNVKPVVLRSSQIHETLKKYDARHDTSLEKFILIKLSDKIVDNLELISPNN